MKLCETFHTVSLKKDSLRGKETSFPELRKNRKDPGPGTGKDCREALAGLPFRRRAWYNETQNKIGSAPRRGRKETILILGIGTDLCEVARIEKSLQRELFLQRVFSPEERELILSRNGKARAETAAANFAAKEAFLKACGVGLGGFALAEIAVVRAPSGQPCYRLLGTAARWAEQKGVIAHLSLTHESGLACAFTVLEGKGEGDA